MKLARADGRRLLVVRTSTGVYALDHACPHEGYGLAQGDLSGELLTCAWHNWKFDVSTGDCVLGEEGVQTHQVTVGDDGHLAVTLARPDPAAVRVRLTESLRAGIEHNRVGQISRDVVRLLRADADPGELVWEALNYGAPRAEYGWGHAVASAVDCLAMVDLFGGDQRAVPVVQAIAGVAEVERGRPENPLPWPASALPAAPEAEFRRLVEAEQTGDAQAVVLAGIYSGLGAAELQRWFTAAVSDHHLSYGHAAIYTQKAFQLLDRIGWDRAATVLPHLVPRIVASTREDTLPYMRPFTRALAGIDLDALAAAPVDPAWRDDGALLDALLGGGDRARPLAAAAQALRQGAGVDGLLDVVSLAVAERMLRYDAAGEFDFHDDFGWLDITHGMTYANAVRWLSRERHDPDVLRLALWCVFQANWTGRHEWHTAVGDVDEVDIGVTGMSPAVAELRAAGERLQRRALDDTTSAFIVHAHAVKTTVAATEEAARTESPLPLQAAKRFLEAPKLERFVAATVARSIDFVAGRSRRPDDADAS